MMMNLFSVFDPSSSLLSMSWLILPLSTLMACSYVSKMSNPTTKIMKKIIFTFKKEVKFSLGSTEKGVEPMIMTIFVLILITNFTALYPQIFSPTSHLAVTLPVSLTFWLSLMMFGWAKNTNHMLAHLVPQGTPPALMMFMVAIEMISNTIRPITLCVRLTANLIAGHLLMSLLGNAMTTVAPLTGAMAMPIPLALTVLESAVACIQAYVFMTLITLYTTEVK